MKKLSVGAWITCIAVVLAIVAFFVYSGNIGGEGYYKDAAVNNLPLMVWGAAAALDVAKEVQTAANMASARSAIWSMALLGAAMLVAVAAAFFSLRKKDT